MTAEPCLTHEECASVVQFLAGFAEPDDFLSAGDVVSFHDEHVV